MKFWGTLFYIVIVAGYLYFVQVFDAYRFKYFLILATIFYLYLWKK